MDFSARPATKDAGRYRRRRSCAPPRFSSTLPQESIGSHAGILDTSEVLAVNPDLIRNREIAVNGGYEGSGVTGDPTRASVARGELFLAIKINSAVEQIRKSLEGGR